MLWPRRKCAKRRVAVAVILASLLATAVPITSLGKSTFDHFTTGFRLEGAHRFADCEACHTDGIFSGTPTQCSGCHTQSSRVNATSKPAYHITTSDRCDACHRASDWQSVLRVDHFEVVGECAACHNGRRAGGQPVGHLPTTDQCDDCHRTTAWVPAAFEHSGIVGACISCHNGIGAMGKPPTHILATDLCEDCHNTMTFSPVRRVDHLQVLGTCSSCHNGSIAGGQPPGHIPTTEECDACHNTMAWR